MPQSETNANVDDDQKPVSSATLRKALNECLDVLGMASKEAIFEDLERSGMHLNDSRNSYSIAQVDKYFRSIFGDDPMELLMERLKNELNKMDDNTKNDGTITYY